MKEEIREFIGKYACLIGFCIGSVIGFIILMII